jgi:hypothetical protein
LRAVARGFPHVNTVDQIGHRGFRFKGVAEVLREEDAFDFLVNDIHARQGADVRVLDALPVVPLALSFRPRV